MEYTELEKENEDLREQLDSVVNDVCYIIDGIGMNVSISECRDCIETAKRLFGIIQEYGDENAQIDALERFAYLTGLSLNE